MQHRFCKIATQFFKASLALSACVTAGTATTALAQSNDMSAFSFSPDEIARTAPFGRIDSNTSNFELITVDGTLRTPLPCVFVTALHPKHVPGVFSVEIPLSLMGVTQPNEKPDSNPRLFNARIVGYRADRTEVVLANQSVHGLSSGMRSEPFGRGATTLFYSVNPIFEVMLEASVTEPLFDVHAELCSFTENVRILEVGTTITEILTPN